VLTPTDHALLADKHAKQEAALKALHDEAAKTAQALWNEASDGVDGHPYLIRKKVQAHGTRICLSGTHDGGKRKGWLMVPGYNAAGELRTVQFIPPKQGSKKLFLSGGEARGAFFLVGTSLEVNTVAVAEGFATAASVFEATGIPCYCAFFAGNLTAVAMAVREKHPTARIVVCADIDGHEAGEKAAIKAASAVDGVVATPYAGKPPAGCSDFNDLSCAEGPEKVKERIALALQGKSTPASAPALPDHMECPSDVLQQAVGWVLHNAHKPQPELSMLAALTAFAAACGGAYHLPDRSRLNLYGIGVAETGTGKDAPQRHAIEMATKAGAQYIGAATSGEALEDAIQRDFQGLFMATDEVAFVIESTNDRAPHLLSLRRNLLRLFSDSCAVFTTRAKVKQESRALRHVAFSWLGFTTPEKLGQALRLSAVADGLVNRCLFVTGRTKVPLRMITKAEEMPTAVRDRLEAIAKVAHGYTGSSGLVGLINDPTDVARITYGKGVGALVDSYTVKLDPERYPDGLQRAMRGRTLQKAMRIAGVLAVIDCPQAPVITTDMVEWAVWYSRKSDETAVAFVEEHSAESEEQADAKRILRAFKAIDKPMVNRSDLMERTRLSSRAFDKAYPNLTERDVLVLEWGATSKAGGRPAQLFAKGSRRAARCAA
jgi:hypothetical protein